MSEALQSLLKPSYPPKVVEISQSVRDELAVQTVKELRAINGKLNFFIVMLILALFVQFLAALV